MRPTKHQLVREIIDLIGADCSKNLLTQRWSELNDHLAKIKISDPTIALVNGYKGKHKVTYCYWNDAVRRSYKTDIYQIEVVKEDARLKRIEHHKANFKSNTIVFWYVEDEFSSGFRGTHIFKNSSKSEVGVWFGGTGHKVFKTDTL